MAVIQTRSCVRWSTTNAVVITSGLWQRLSPCDSLARRLARNGLAKSRRSELLRVSQNGGIFNFASFFCKPVPVSAGASPNARQSFLWVPYCYGTLAAYPGVIARRAASAPLFGLAPRGVCPARNDCSPCGALLPHLFTLTLPLWGKAVHFLWHFPSKSL